MKMALTFLGLLFGFIIGIAYCADSSSSESLQSKSSEEMGKSKWKLMGCENKAEVYSFEPEVMKEIEACEVTCRHFCHIKILSLINDNGLPDEGLYKQWVDETFPEKYKSFSNQFFGDCFQKYGNKIDLSDKECKIADQFADCTWGLVAQMKCAE